MINEILWNLINTREVAIFIDNVIVRMEEEKEYNEEIEEAVKKLIKNDLYVKPEKCK